MSETIARSGAARAIRKLDHAYQFGQSVEQPGIITAAHTATWHMAGMIEQLHALRRDQAEQLRRGELSAGPVCPGEEPTT